MDDKTENIWRVLDTVKDPCMQAAGLDISLVGLGIVRSVDIEDKQLTVKLGLTEPGCGFTHILMTQVEDALAPHLGGMTLDVGFNWSDPWSEDLMTPKAREQFTSARAASRQMLAKRGIGPASPASSEASAP